MVQDKPIRISVKIERDSLRLKRSYRRVTKSPETGFLWQNNNLGYMEETRGLSTVVLTTLFNEYDRVRIFLSKPARIIMLATSPTYTIAWEKLPDDFVLPEEPVDNINQPALAAALTESLQLAGKLPETALTPTNYGICATINGKIAVKAPDWAYIPQITVSRGEVVRSYTPRLQGEIPVLVLEFLSDTEGGEYSVKETYPPGKFFFYEQILQVPNYGIFEPESGLLELYRFGDAKRYRLESANEQGWFWIPEMQLFLGVWQATRENRQGYWLRWRDEQGNLLLWGAERIEQERQRAEQERQRAEQERQRAEQERQRAEGLAAQLRAAGIEPLG